MKLTDWLLIEVALLLIGLTKTVCNRIASEVVGAGSVLMKNPVGVQRSIKTRRRRVSVPSAVAIVLRKLAGVVCYWCT